MKAWPLAILLLFVTTLFGQQSNRSVQIDDNSDWWSLMKTDEPIASKVDPIRTPNPSLEILGISLLDQHLFARISKTLGPAVEVERGDGATGRQQYCYVSSGSGRKVYLIFEFGEAESAFYLFTDGRDWDGSRYCHPSKLVSDRIGTKSGVRLGMTREQVEGILGKPTIVEGDRIKYARSLSVKSTAEELKRARTYAPDMNEKDFEANYGHWDFTTDIVAGFKDSKLYYLALAQDETL